MEEGAMEIPDDPSVILIDFQRRHPLSLPPTFLTR